MPPKWWFSPSFPVKTTPKRVPSKNTHTRLRIWALQALRSAKASMPGFTSPRASELETWPAPRGAEPIRTDGLASVPYSVGHPLMESHGFARVPTLFPAQGWNFKHHLLGNPIRRELPLGWCFSRKKFREPRCTGVPDLVLGSCTETFGIAKVRKLAPCRTLAHLQLPLLGSPF